MLGKQQYVQLLALAAVVGIGLGALPACSSLSPDDPSANGLACEFPADASLTDDAVCADSGIRAGSLFSFANWAGHKYESDHFGFEEMLAAFGENKICRKVENGQCIVSADGQVIQEMLDELIANGRCEGLVALGALYATKRGPRPDDFGVDALDELSPDIESFGNVIDYWWSTQFTKGAVTAAAMSRGGTLNQTLRTVISALRSGRGATLGLYFDGRGHGVLPVAVSKSGESTFVVHVWDSNSPHELRSVAIDLAAKTWSFDRGAQAGGGAKSLTWSGNEGTIDVTLLDDRQGGLAMDIGESRGDVTVVASGGARQDLTISIAVANGESLRISASGTTGGIEGSTVTPLKSGLGSQYLVSLPSDVGDLKIDTSIGAGVGSSDDSRVTINDPLHGVVSVAIPSNAGESTTSISLQGVGGDRSARVASSGAVEILSAVNDAVLSVPIAANEVATVADNSDNGNAATVTIEAAGNEPVTTVIPATREATTQQITIGRSPEGELVQSRRETTSIPMTPSSDVKDVAGAIDSEGASVMPIPEAAKSTKLSVAESSVGPTSVVLTGRVASGVSSAAWFEYQPTDDEGSPARTPERVMAAGLSETIIDTVVDLKPGTNYRYRLTARVDGFNVYSVWRSFLTETDATTAATLDPAQVLVDSVSVSVTATSAIVTGRATSPAGGQVLAEFYEVGDEAKTRRTTATLFNAGATKSVTALINGLRSGVVYQTRLAIVAGGLTKYSTWVTFTPKVRQATAPGTTVVKKFNSSLTIRDITSTSAVATFTVTSTSPGAVQLEYRFAEAGALTLKTTVKSFVAGGSVTVDFILDGLKPSQNYEVRPAYTVDDMTAYGRFISFATSDLEPTTTAPATTTAPPANGETTAPTTTPLRQFVPLVVEGSVGDDTVKIKVVVPPNDGGFVGLQYSPDNAQAALEDAIPKRLVDESTSVVFEIGALESGMRHRVRVVRTTSSGVTTRSDFVTFATTGNARAVLYKPIVNKPLRIDGGYRVSWASPRSDIPQAASYRVAVDAKEVCTTTPTDKTCDVLDLATGMHSITVSAILESGQIVAADPINAPVGLPPVINDFAFVSATGTGMVFTYGFDPRGETVQYGVEVRTRPGNTFVKAQLGGETSDERSGETLQVTGLAVGTDYKARLVIFIGQSMISSDWVDVATTS